MAELQSVPLAADVQYFLDGALDMFELNAFDHAALTLYGDRRTVTEIVDRDIGSHRGRHFVPARVEKCLELDTHAHSVTADLPEADRRALFAAALIREPARLDSLAACFTQWAIGDAMLGGFGEKWRRRPRLLPGDRIPTRWSNRLSTERYVAHYVRNNDDLSLNDYRTLATHLRALPWPESVEEANHLHQFYEETRRRYADANRRGMEEMLINERARLLRDGVELGPGDWRALRYAKDRKAKAKRKVAARAAQAAMSVLPADDVRVFLRGEPIILSTDSFALRVTKGGINGITIRLENGAGSDLAGLCLYFEDTPASDQLAALALHAAAGEEGVLLARGNLYGVTPEGARHPLIADRLRKSGAPAGEEGVFDVNGPGLPYVRVVNREHQRAVCQAFAERTKPLYLAEVTAQVWGEDAPKLIAFAEQVAALPAEMLAA